MSTHIEKPIFLIGMPRSGTTLIFEIFTVHPEAAWFSTFTDRFPLLPLIATCLLSRIGKNPAFRYTKPQRNDNWLKRKSPYPAEAYKFWESCCGKKFKFDFLNGVVGTEKEKQCVRNAVEKQIKYQGASRFTAKITGPARIGYLNSIFPDALFIHIIRDGRAVVNSLHNVKFWTERGGLEKPWWSNGLTDEDLQSWRDSKKSSHTLAALQWRRLILKARQEAAQIAPERYMEIRYEDFIDAPQRRMDELFRFSALAPCQTVHQYIDRLGIKNMNYKFRDTFTEEELKAVTDVSGDLLKQLHYA